MKFHTDKNCKTVAVLSDADVSAAMRTYDVLLQASRGDGEDAEKLTQLAADLKDWVRSRKQQPVSKKAKQADECEGHRKLVD